MVECFKDGKPENQCERRISAIVAAESACDYKQDLAAYEMQDSIIKELAECSDWYNFNEMGRVITFVYQEVERDHL